MISKITLLCLLGIAPLLFNTHENWKASAEKAKAEHKNLVIYFSGSDWCSSCHAFSKRILADPLMQSTLEQKVVFYTADFPTKTKQDAALVSDNESLAAKYNANGVFPKLVVVSPNGKLLKEMYNNKASDVAFYISQIETAAHE